MYFRWLVLGLKKETGDGNLEILLNVDLVRNFVSKFETRQLREVSLKETPQLVEPRPSEFLG